MPTPEVGQSLVDFVKLIGREDVCPIVLLSKGFAVPDQLAPELRGEAAGQLLREMGLGLQVTGRPYLVLVPVRVVADIGLAP